MERPDQIRQQITQQIITALEGNIIPWRRPWSVSPNTGHPANVISRRGYSGINPLLLQLHALRYGFSSRWWATFQQWSDLGCVVQRRPDDVDPGAWGCRIVFYSPLTRKVVDQQTGEESEKTFPLLRAYTVFNADQVVGEAAEKLRVVEASGTDDRPNFEPAEQLIAASKAEVRFGGDKAFYRRPDPDGAWPNHTDGDFIQMPHRATFPEVRDFYGTVMHEMAHWSEVRTGWDHRQRGYALGELAAEMGACYLTQELGIPGSEDLSNHAAYIGDWLKAMKGDPSFIFKASSQASRVSDYLLGLVRPPQVTADEDVQAA